LSTETLKSIAGIAKEAGVESNVIDVVTQGECDFLSGLTPGSYYYSSGTGFLSASVGDYEVGVAKSATNLVMLERITKVNEEFLRYIDELVVSSKTPSVPFARRYDFWKTREVKTTSGVFTVPAGVYVIGIFCFGKGADGSNNSNSGGGGGFSAKIKKVQPGDSIPYAIASNIASCDGMVANPGSSTSGGTASGGMINASGGSGASGGTKTGGGGVGGGAGGGGGAQTYGAGGGGARLWHLAGGEGGASNSSGSSGGGGCDGGNGRSFSGGGCRSGASFGSIDSNKIPNNAGSEPAQMGWFVTSDITGNTSQSQNGVVGGGDYNGGAGGFNGGVLAGTGPNCSQGATKIGGGGGGGCSNGAENGGLGGGAGNSGVGGYGGGGGSSGTCIGGAAVVIFIY
jgi:hypothetical protein